MKAQVISDIDSLTGLLTRRRFDDELKRTLEKAKNGEGTLSLAFLDIDHFKLINDTYGHSTGDAVIQNVVAHVRQALGAATLLGRYGGEEFAVLLPGVEREQALLALERARLEVEKPQPFLSGKKKVELTVTVSGGISAFPLDGRTESEMIRKADQALYRAKATGRNKICLAQEERMMTKTTHYPQTQLERLAQLAQKEGLGEAVLLREALDDLLLKYGVSEVES